VGMYPSADLSYGIVIGEWSYDEPTEDEPVCEEYPWLTWERWSKSWEIETVSSQYLTEQGIEDVVLSSHGHPDRPVWVLASRSFGCYGWNTATTITAEGLTVTDDNDRLERAFALLFPDQTDHPGPLWILSATFD
jgi:hypothetical protein